MNAPAPRRAAAPHGDGAPPGRLAEADALKVAGLVVIVLIHSIRPRWDPAVSTAELWLGDVTRFAVPGFLAVSGYLAATSRPVPWARTAGRLRRVLVPYLVASIVAQVFWFAQGSGPQRGSILEDLLLGSSFGPYYYVFVIAGLFLIAPLLPRVPRPALAAALVPLLVTQWVSETDVLGAVDPFWEARSPLFWWAYFLAGWLLGLERERAQAWMAARRAPVVIALALVVVAGAVAVALLEPQTVARVTVAWATIWAVLALAWAAACGRAGLPEIAWLSGTTYAVYLFHLFFVLPVQALVPAPPGRLDPLAVALPWFAGLAGSLLLVVLARRLVPRASRDLTGA